MDLQSDVGKNKTTCIGEIKLILKRKNIGFMGFKNKTQNIVLESSKKLEIQKTKLFRNPEEYSLILQGFTTCKT